MDIFTIIMIRPTFRDPHHTLLTLKEKWMLAFSMSERHSGATSPLSLVEKILGRLRRDEKMNFFCSVSVHAALLSRLNEHKG